jgi:hypothetical protein
MVEGMRNSDEKKINDNGLTSPNRFKTKTPASHTRDEGSIGWAGRG